MFRAITARRRDLIQAPRKHVPDDTHHEGRPKIAIVYRYVPHYRRAFYNGLRMELDSRGIDLQVLYGQPIAADASKSASVELEWGTRIRNYTLTLCGRTLCWQPVLKATSSANLVIVEQANRLIVNYALLARQRLGGPPVAFWGHGRNLQAGASILNSASEALKRLVSKAPAWWFAYTEGSASTVAALGYPPDRITAVHNSIDLGELSIPERPTPRTVASFYGCMPSNSLCLYIGSLYEDKCLDLLMAAGERIATARPDFELGIIGDGPLRPWLEALAPSRPWLNVLGPRFGSDLAAMANPARCLLMPGAVGLVALDSFALGLPIVTIAHKRHGPEVEYLRSGVNSVVLDGEVTADTYATCVLTLLADDSRLRRLSAGAHESARAYGVERMVTLYADGIEAALRSVNNGSISWNRQVRGDRGYRPSLRRSAPCAPGRGAWLSGNRN